VPRNTSEIISVQFGANEVHIETREMSPYQEPLSNYWLYVIFMIGFMLSPQDFHEKPD